VLGGYQLRFHRAIYLHPHRRSRSAGHYLQFAALGQVGVAYSTLSRPATEPRPILMRLSVARCQPADAQHFNRSGFRTPRSPALSRSPSR